MKQMLLWVLVLCMWAAPARAAIIAPIDLDTLVLGSEINSVTVPILTAAPAPLTMGVLGSEVFFNGAVFTYVNTVTPSVDDVSHFNTAFPIAGFTGTAGWSFSDALAAGGTGLQFDFLVVNDDETNRLHWLAINQTMGENWDAGEAMSFFFQSTLPPGRGDYNLLNAEAGTAVNALAPIPEPASLLLLGSGLAAAGALVRRRKRQSQQP